MGKIVQLPDDVIDHIAAGEVVDRPASALKELVENAIDANARRIRIDVAEDASALRVSDDGEGMEPEDAEICFLRHATSKLRRREDLAVVNTLGFRGEALAAIAAVAELEILTRPRHRPEGFRVIIAGGQKMSAGPAPAPEGTTVWVRRLFFNTPARRRYLKSGAAEQRACVEAAARIALGHPGVAFEVTAGREVRFATPGDGDIRAAAAAVIGPQEAGVLLPAGGARGPVTLRGLIGPPDLTRPRRDHLWTFVNGRWVQDRTVATAAVRGFEGRLAPGRFPVAFVYLDVDPSWVDVNVHPAKLFVRFRDEHLIFSLVVTAVREALRSAPPVMLAARSAPSPTGQLLSPPGLPPAPAKAAEPAALPWGAASREPLPAQLRRLKAVGQLFATYILAEAPGALMVVDQHVAHERLIFEQMLKARAGSPAPAQQLLAPVTLELTWAAAEALRPLLPWLGRVGLQAEAFGPRHVLVRSLPAVPGFPAAPHENELRALFEALARELPELPEAPGAHLEESAAPAPWELRLLKNVACKSAVKAGTALNTAAMRMLVEGLALADNPYTCPHGRPVVVSIPVEELDRRFGRRTPP
ncbi:MAG: DNA mismatch repair endonuclease MutL [Bacillota bacterium]